MQNTAAAIAAQVRSRRKSMGWSQEELAKRAGVAAGTVSSLEQGKKLRPGNLHAIRTTLGLPDGDGEQEPADSPRAAKIRFMHELVDKWLDARPDEDLESEAEEFTRWVMGRMAMRRGS